jgi:hypothetical protein
LTQAKQFLSEQTDLNFQGFMEAAAKAGERQARRVAPRRAGAAFRFIGPAEATKNRDALNTRVADAKKLPLRFGGSNAV